MPTADRSTGLRFALIDYLLDDPGRPNSTRYRLLTDMRAPDQAPARALATLYAQHSEFRDHLG